MEEIQRTLLSIVFLYPDERYLIFKGLEDKHFMNQYKTIFNACKKLYMANKEIDPVVVISDIGTDYMNTIAQLADLSLIIKPNTAEYIKILKDNYSRMHAMTLTKELLLNIEKGKLNNQEIQNRYLDISKLFNEESKIKKVNMLQGFSELFDDLEQKTEYMKTWYERLDKYVLIDKGDYILIGGRPSSGKTTFAVNLMLSLSAKYTVDFFSLETGSLKVFRKIAATSGRININRIQNKYLHDDEYNNLVNAANECSKYKLNVIEAAGMSVQDITSTALQDKADIIFIDYIQLIKGRGNNIYEQTTNVSKDLHTFAQKENVTVIALAQLNRAPTIKREPNMSDLRDSGQLEQDADVIILMYQPDESEDINKQSRDCIIAKNKTGETGKIRLKFFGGTQTFKEA